MRPECRGGAGRPLGQDAEQAVGAGAGRDRPARHGAQGS